MSWENSLQVDVAPLANVLRKLGSTSSILWILVIHTSFFFSKSPNLWVTLRDTEVTIAWVKAPFLEEL